MIGDLEAAGLEVVDLGEVAGLENALGVVLHALLESLELLLRASLRFGPLEVVVFPVQEHHHVGLLLYLAGVAQVGELRTPALALAAGAGQLRQQHHRNAQLDRQRLGEADHGGLGRTVDGVVRERLEPGRRAGVDDPPATLRQHRRQEQTGQRDECLDVQADRVELLVERLNPARSLTHHPLVQVVLAWQNYDPSAAVRLGDLEVTALPIDTRTARMDLSVSMAERFTDTGEPGVLDTVASVVANLKSCVGQTFTGYKGGEFLMDGTTQVYCDNWGRYSSTHIVAVMDLDYAVILETRYSP